MEGTSLQNKAQCLLGRARWGPIRSGLDLLTLATSAPRLLSYVTSYDLINLVSEEKLVWL